MRFASSAGLSVLVLATGVLSLGLAGPDDPAKLPTADSAARRELAGDDAKRVEELQKKIEELRQADNYNEAQAAARMILEIRRRVQGTEHWQTGDAQRLLRTLEQIAALPADARAELAEATKLRGEAAKLKPPARYERALPLLQRALEIRQRHLGAEHSDVADAMHELAGFLHESGRCAEAELLYQKALALRRRLLGEEDPRTAESYNDLALNVEGQGRYAEAEPLLQKALALDRKVLGEEHLDTATIYNNLAVNLYNQGRYVVAEPFFQKALALYRKLQGEEHPSTALGYHNLASNLKRQGKYAEAEPLFRRALALYRKLQGEEHRDTARGYNSLASNLYAQAKYAEAEPLFQNALALRRRLLGEEHRDTAESYNDLAGNLYAQGKYAEAEPLCQKALAIRRKVLGEEHPDTATSYHNLASILKDQGKYAEAEPLYQRALAIHRKLLGEEHPSTAGGYNSLATNLYAQGKHAEAEPLLQKALALRRKLLGEEHPDTASSYHNLANNLNAQGKYAEAEPLFQKALAVRRKLLGEEHPSTARGYNSLAHNLNAQGKYAEAESLYQKALTLSRKLLREEHPDTAESYLGLAVNLNSQGKYVEAEPLYQKALTLHRKLLGEEHPNTAASYSNLASNLKRQGKYAEAEPLYQKALALYRKLLGEEHPHTATSYNNLASNLSAQGKHAEAEPLLQKALALHRKLLGEEHPDTAQSYKNLAADLNAQGKYAKAEEQWTRAAHSFASARLQIHFGGLDRASFASERSPLPALAAVLARQGKGSAAWQQLEANLARGLLDDLSAQQTRNLDPGEIHREQELSGRLRQLDLQITAVRNRSAALQACADTSLAGQLLFPLRWRATALCDPSQAIWQSTFQLGWNHRQNLESLVGQRLTVQAQVSQLEQELVAKYGIAAGQTYELARIQARLPAEAALLAWLDIKGQPNAADPDGEHWACLVRQRGEPAWIKLPGNGTNSAWTKEDDDLPAQVRQILANRPQDLAAAWEPLTRRLAAQRLAPVEAFLHADQGSPAVRHLIILPSSAVAGIPVEALTERYTVSYAPSATMFVWLQEERHKAADKEHTSGSLRLLALGDPVFEKPQAPTIPALEPPPHGVLLTQVQPGSTAARKGLRAGDVLLSYAGTKLTGPADLQPVLQKASSGEAAVPLQVWREGKVLDLAIQPGRLGVMLSKQPAAQTILAQREGDQLVRSATAEAFSPLPGTRREVAAIARLFPDKEVLLGSEASEQHLDALATADRLRGFRFLHFATHGVLNEQIALQSVLILARDQLPDPIEQMLAGKPVYDGKLTAEQIRRSWRLDAELVTLSACQSGLGKYSGGEGYLGFSQALFLAGARSLVLSLWKVPDDATGLLMTRFYENLLGARPGLPRPLPKAEALHEAKRWLRRLTAEEVASFRTDLSAQERGETTFLERPAQPVPVHPYGHPYYWSAFILIGDPNEASSPAHEERVASVTPVGLATVEQRQPISPGWNTIGLALLAVVLLVSVAACWKRSGLPWRGRRGREHG